MANSFWDDDAYDLPKASSNNTKSTKSSSFWDDDAYDVPKNNSTINKKPVSQPAKPKVASKPVSTVAKPIQSTQPLTGGVQKNYVQNWDKKGRVYYTDVNGNKVKPQNSVNQLEKLGRKVQAKLTNIDASINRPSEEQMKNRQELGKFLAIMGATSFVPNPLNPVIGNVAKTAIKPVGAITKNITNKAANRVIKGVANNAVRAGASAVKGAADSVPWSLGEYGVEKLLGYNTGETLPEKIKHNAKEFAKFTAVASPVIQGAKYATKTKLAKEIAESARNQLDAHPAVADAVVGVKNFFTPEAKFQNKNDTLAKLEKLDDVKNKKPDFTNEHLSDIKQAEGIPINDFGAMHRELTEGGEELNKVKQELYPPVVKENNEQLFKNIEDRYLKTEESINQDSVDMFGKNFSELNPEEQQSLIRHYDDIYNPVLPDEVINTNDLVATANNASIHLFGKPYENLSDVEAEVVAKKLEEKFNSKLQASESNLSHVKEQDNIISPKEEQTPVKNDSGMANEIKQQPEVKTEIPEGWYQDEFGNIVKKPPRAKIQRFNKEELVKEQAERQNKDAIGIKPKKELKEEINNEQKFEYVPEQPNESLTGTVPQPEIKPKKPGNMYSQKEKNEIRQRAKQAQKETNNFKFPEEKVTKLESGAAEGSDTSWNTHAVRKQANYDEEYNLGASQKQYQRSFEKGSEEVNSVQTAKSSRYVKDDAEFQKFYDDYIQASPEKKQALLADKLKEIKQNKDSKAASDFYEDIMNQVERDKIRYEKGLSDVEVSDITESRNIAKAFKDNEIDVDTMKQEHIVSEKDKTTADVKLFSLLPAKIKEKLKDTDKTLYALFDRYNTPENLNKQYKKIYSQIRLSHASDEVKRAMYDKLNEVAKNIDKKKNINIDTIAPSTSMKINKNELLDKINQAIKDEDALTLQRILTDNIKELTRAKDSLTVKTRQEAFSKASQLARKEMQAALDAGDFKKFEEIAKRTESIRRNDKTLHSLQEGKEWSNKEELILDKNGNPIAQGEIRGKVSNGQTFDYELGLHRDIQDVKDKFISWEQEKKYWKEKLKEAKELPNQIQEHINRTGVDKDVAKTIVKSNNKFKEKVKDTLKVVKEKLSKKEKLSDYEKEVYINYKARKNAQKITTFEDFSKTDKEIEDFVKKNGLSKEEIILFDKNNVEEFGKADGNAHPKFLEALINVSNRTKEQIKKTIFHEGQHIADFKKILTLPKEHPIRKFYSIYKKDYNEARSIIRWCNCNKSILNNVKNDVLDKLLKLDENGIPILKNSDEYANIIIDSFKKGEIDAKVANFLTKYNDAVTTYLEHPLEKRSFNVMRGIENRKDVLNELEEFFKGKYGEEYEKYSEKYRGKSVQRDRLPLRNRRDIETNGQRNIQKTTESGTEITKGKNVILEKDQKGIKDFHYSPDGTFDQLSFDLNKSKSLFKTEGQKQTFKKLVKYSTEDEKTLIDLGILTPEQAKNRLRKQHYKGEGVYIPTVYKKSKGNINIEKDYMEGRRNKKGVFGQKKEYGVDREVDAKETVIKTIERHIDIEHVKNVSKTVEDLFAEPIVNNEIKKGYIGVNKNLLNTMMYGKYSKDWYKTLSSGYDSIAKAFKDPEVKKGWFDLFSRSSDKNFNIKYDYQIPESVFNKLVDGTGEKANEWWSRYAGKSFANKIKGVGHYVGAINDALLNNFKKRVLTSSSFFVNNRIGNQIMIAMNSDSPIDYLKSYKGVFKYKNSDVPTEIIQNSLLEAAENSTVRRMYTGNNALDNALNLFNGNLIETKNLTGMKKLGAKTANVVIGLPNKGFNKLSEKVMKFNQLAEDAERRQIFSQIVDKSKRDLIKKTGQNMVKEEEILKHINSDSEIHALVVKEIEDTLGDYKNFSPLEQKVLKRIVPFYSWYRTISRHTVKLLKEYPERAALLALELKHFDELAEDNKIKEYQRFSLPLKLIEKRTSKNLVVNKGHAIPYMTFKELLDEGGKGSISPLIRVPLEAARGKKFFLDQEISNSRYIRTGYKYNTKERKYDDAYYDIKKQDWVKNKKGNVKLEKNQNLGKFNYGALPISTRLGYVGKELLTDTVAPYLNNSLINGEKLLTTGYNYAKTGKLKVPDRIYDASFGGYNHDDLVGFTVKKNKELKPITRYVGNRLSPKAQISNALLGLSLQNRADMNKKEESELKEKKKKEIIKQIEKAQKRAKKSKQ